MKHFILQGNLKLERQIRRSCSTGGKKTDNKVLLKPIGTEL